MYYRRYKQISYWNFEKQISGDILENQIVTERYEDVRCRKRTSLLKLGVESLNNPFLLLSIFTSHLNSNQKYHNTVRNVVTNRKKNLPSLMALNYNFIGCVKKEFINVIQLFHFHPNKNVICILVYGPSFKCHSIAIEIKENAIVTFFSNHKLLNQSKYWWK